MKRLFLWVTAWFRGQATDPSAIAQTEFGVTEIPGEAYVLLRK